ncbi:DUF4386 domain-containing protein [Candidatus Thorarchaeota archaeon]|nr:MAG: DUF4386 domain-containing protein [Candidatus Thorarchaeota archaeon]
MIMFAEISGLLFLIIIVNLLIAGQKYGYETFSELDVDAKLQKVNEDPVKFRTGIKLIIIEHAIIITLAMALFIAFSSYNLLLGVIWVFARATEGLMQINNKLNFLDLSTVAEHYPDSTGLEKEAMSNVALSLLRSKNSTFTRAQLLFSIGTFAYSITFVLYGIVPLLLGWFGIAASIIYGLGTGIYIVKDSKALWNLGGFLIFIFELILGGWLLFYSIIP